jgi:hypothetical protein
MITKYEFYLDLLKKDTGLSRDYRRVVCLLVSVNSTIAFVFRISQVVEMYNYEARVQTMRLCN